MAQSTGPLSFTEQFALRNLGNNKFETINNPQRMGNPSNIAYGGYALDTACKAACLSVPEGYHLYSMLGNYLGPAYTDRPLRVSVREIRQTRTFATRQVEISQERDDGKKRTCLMGLADFQVQEQAALLKYSRAPNESYPHWKDCPTQHDAEQKLLDEGKISQVLLDAHTANFSLMPAIFDQRSIPSSIFAQNLYGMAKYLPHSQDSLPLAKRTTADWFRCHQPLPTTADHTTNLAFLIDGAIAFTPLSFSHLFFEDVAAVSSLDFALRFFINDVDVTQWHLREMSTTVGAEGRSFGESWVWDERGRAVAYMSQQSILRPKVERKERAEKL
ncbi:Thioesterase/thiol ester dehydrase-isomerase [Cucurbitaria berberidis CBS 394.84]|uniref:Thioesterase/thiol ester dehydrase-isomerase n=1 Tax=Cucurbitaria berberidis CBS 394.84 TaxID=1168544 RepID=A0A9P4GH53_9PLEO|nr:Thioesterase/thiol ester dehydrase-isomerase [Cucurbitaria berberidis CBS 394.84]KAF1845341.1 Thioesterase/thiol ester dehydrase-isomerase [Cucurbitaria berberidis CBS 394.84]